jgi:hypothetical protein
MGPLNGCVFSAGYEKKVHENDTHGPSPMFFALLRGHVPIVTQSSFLRAPGRPGLSNPPERRRGCRKEDKGHSRTGSSFCRA